MNCLRDSTNEAPTHGNIADIFEEELKLRSAPGELLSLSSQHFKLPDRNAWGLSKVINMHIPIIVCLILFMAIIISRYISGFIESYDGHTRDTGNTRTKMPVFHEGKAVDESLLMQGGYHHLPKQTGK